MELREVSLTDLERPTPCSAWNLGQLLWHVTDSLDAVHEGIVTGDIVLDTHRAPLDPEVGPKVAAVTMATPLFAPPVAVDSSATATDEFVAFLGRTPR